MKEAVNNGYHGRHGRASGRTDEQTDSQSDRWVFFLTRFIIGLSATFQWYTIRYRPTNSIPLATSIQSNTLSQTELSCTKSEI